MKFKGLEFLGIYELASGYNEITTIMPDKEGSFTQLAAELVYRFGKNDWFYFAGRYKTVKGKAMESATEDLKINQLNIGEGWFLSKNIVTKVEYVNHQYTRNAWTGRFTGAEFKGLNIKAAICF